MTTEVTIPEAVGDWLLRGPDYDTELAGPITDSIIDAAALVDSRWRNGFPNWELHRAAIAEDALYVPDLRRWVVAFSVAHCLSGGVRMDAFSEELACIAAWDALHITLHARELLPPTNLASVIGVDRKTYLGVRNAIVRRLYSSLTEYRSQLLVAMIEIKSRERKSGFATSGEIVRTRGSCFSAEDLRGGSGNYVRIKARDSDTL